LRGFTCHEVRNPLNSIINSAERIEEFLKDLLGEMPNHDINENGNPLSRIKINL
jgi:signal transduction histidine kinase